MAQELISHTTGGQVTANRKLAVFAWGGEAENYHSPVSLKVSLGCLVSKKTEPGVQPAGSCCVGQMPLEHISLLGFIFSELPALLRVVLYTTMGTVQRKANFTL